MGGEEPCAWPCGPGSGVWPGPCCSRGGCVVASITVWLVPALATLKLAALNLAVVLGALYLLRGAAVVVAFASATGIPVGALVLAAAVSALLAVPLLLLLPGLWTLGMTDTWLQFRRRLAGRKPHL